MDDDVPTYVLRLSGPYERGQLEYESMFRSDNPNAAQMLLMRCPYLPDVLLMMSELHAMRGESDAAEDLLERCVYGLENAWRPGFVASLAQGVVVPDEGIDTAQFKALARRAKMGFERHDWQHRSGQKARSQLR